MENDWKYQMFCRICFECAPELLELSTFLPIIRFVANTKIPCEDEKSSKICSSCANCLIMANLFRIKVIDSNGKYREFLKEGAIKKEQDVSEDTVEKIEDANYEIIEESLQYDEQDHMSDNYMHVEFLVETSDTIEQLVKPYPRKNRKLEISSIVKDSLNKSEEKYKPLNEASGDFINQVESQPVCFICTEPAPKKNSFTPFKETLSRIVPIHNCSAVEYVCQKCTKKLEDSKVFFTRLDQAKKNTIKKDCCVICSAKVSHSLKPINKNSTEVFNSLHNSGCNLEINEKSLVCGNCVQLLTKIRMVRNSYNTKEKFFAKQQNRSNSTITKTSRKHPRKTNDYDDSYMDDSQMVSTYLSKAPPKRKPKRLRIKSTSNYVEPNPDEPLPEDYQCHMSDFEEIDSDTDIPEVPFRSPLNVPFRHKYIKCPECNLQFVNSCELDVHFEIIHETVDDVCNVCHKAFRDVRTTKEHKLSCHTHEFSAFNFRKLCDICGLAKRKFENHYVIHFDVRAFKCQLCSCDYKTKVMLEDHIRTVHMGEKRHKCAYCDKRFSYAADKVRHEIGVHTKKFKYICQFCGKCFLKKNFLTAHQKSQHAEMLLELTNQNDLKTEDLRADL